MELRNTLWLLSPKVKDTCWWRNEITKQIIMKLLFTYLCFWGAGDSLLLPEGGGLGAGDASFFLSFFFLCFFDLKNKQTRKWNTSKRHNEITNHYKLGKFYVPLSFDRCILLTGCCRLMLFLLLLLLVLVLLVLFRFARAEKNERN